MQGDREERIRHRAYELWERDGQPEGRHDKHWAQASAEIEAEIREEHRRAAGSEAASDVGGSDVGGSDVGSVVKKVVRRTKKAAADALGAGINAVVDVVEETIAPKKPRARKAATETKAAAETKAEPAAKPAAAKPKAGEAGKVEKAEPATAAKPRRKSATGQNTQAVH